MNAPAVSINMKYRILSGQIAVFLALGTCRIFGQPYIDYFTPTFGSYADPALINIFGGGFTNNTPIVKFNGVTATAGRVSTTQLQAQVPAGAPVGPGKIFVQVGPLSTLSTDDFYVLGPGPYISDFTPTQGGGTTVVTINGAHFANPMTVKFNTATTNGNLTASPSQFKLTPPSGATSGFITVSNAAGTYTDTNQLFYLPPSISGFSTNTGRTGTNVVITGQNFLGASAVSFGGTPAGFIPPTNNTTLRATVPLGAATGKILVTAPAGAFQTTSNFVVKPTIFGFSPGFGPAGTTSVTVTGANLDVSGFSVKFGGLTAPNHSTPTFSQFTVTVPNGATNAPLTVTTADGSHTSAQVFYLPPGISGFTPTNTGPGSTVRITGSNFIGASALTFNGTPATTFNVTNNTTIGAVVPSGVITGPITITTPAGTTNSGTFLFYGAPTIGSFNPTHGLPGTNVMISGLNFLGATKVLFGGINASFTVTNNTTIGALVPPNAPSGPITVVAPAGTNISAGNFTIDSSDVAVILADSPDPVFVGSNLLYTITVTNGGLFAAANIKLTNTLPASVRLRSATTSQGTLNTNANPILGSLGTLNSGGSATITLTVVPQVPGTVTNIDSAAGDIPDAIPSNNSGSISTVIWPLPVLSIAPLTNQVQVSWPAVLSNFSLQFKGALAAPYNWSNVPTPPVISGTNNVVIEDITNVTKFFRLKL